MLSKWGQRFSPLSLFAAGEQGGWWDPSDFGTMFQDSAGTTPVTAVGQPVGLIRDKSGRGNHRTQSTTASRPTLQQDASGFFYLSYDGVDDFMVTGSVDFSASDKMSLHVGINKLSDAAQSMFAELSAILDNNNGTFGLLAPTGAAAGNYRFVSKGTVVSSATSPFRALTKDVVSCVGDIGGALATARVNGAVAGTSATTQGTGTYGNYPIYFGCRGGTTLPFTGREYQTIVRGAASTAAQIAQAERFVGSKIGIVL